MRANPYRREVECDPAERGRPPKYLLCLGSRLSHRLRRVAPHQLLQPCVSIDACSGSRFAVGTAVASRPPRRSVRAGFPHTAPTLSK